MTVSTSRYQRSLKGDESGDEAERLIEASGGKVLGRVLVSDDRRQIGRALSRALANRSVDVVVFTGGTGVSTTDVTIESVRPRLEKELEGFGEILRAVSYEKIGAAAALSRATAGVANGKLVMCLPGSPDAVRTALDLYLVEVPHILYLARGQTKRSLH